MTVTATNVFSGPFTPNGVTTTFPFTFEVDDPSEVAAYLNDALVDPSLYTATLNEDGTGSVTFFTAPVGTRLILSANPAFDQPSTLQNQGPYFQSTVERMIDRQALRSLYLRSLMLRAILFPEGENGVVLPLAASRAETLLGFGPGGAVELVPQSDLTAALDAQTAAQGYASQAAASVNAIVAALAAATVQPNMAVPVTNRTVMASLASTSRLAYLLGNDGGPFQWNAASQWSGRIALAAISGMSTVVDQGERQWLVTKTGPTNDDYDEAISTTHQFAGNARIFFRAPGGNGSFMIGFDQSASPRDFNTMDWGTTFGGGSLRPRKNGVADGAAVIPVDSTHWFCVELFANVIEVRECPNGPTLTGSSGLFTFTGSVPSGQYLHLAIYGTSNDMEVIALDTSNVGTGLVQADTRQAVSVAPAADTSGAGGAWLRDFGRLHVGWAAVTPENGGVDNAVGLRACGRLLEHYGYLDIEFARNATYNAGRQEVGDGVNYSVAPGDVLYASGFRGGKVFLNGSTLTAPDGLKAGGYNLDGTVYPSVAPFGDATKLAVPYTGLIEVEDYDDYFEIDLGGGVIDGNAGGMAYGGEWGFTSYEIPSHGVRVHPSPGARFVLRNGTIRNCVSDGLYYQGDATTRGAEQSALLVEDMLFELNGRQGCSVTGGRGGTFNRCTFRESGKGVLNTNPAAGFDMEPDSLQWARAYTFNECDFYNNAGFAYGGGTGRIHEITFNNCRFGGETEKAVYCGKPGQTFNDCLIVGAILDTTIDLLPDTGDPLYPYERGFATRYNNCIITNDPQQGYGAAVSATPGAISGQAIFNQCVWDFEAGTQGLPTATEEVTMRDCRIYADLGGPMPFNCRFEGHTFVSTGGYSSNANQVFSGAEIYGTLVIDGVENFVGSKTHDFGSIAAAGSASTTVTVPGANVNDKRTYSATLSTGFGGLMVTCEVTALNTVTVTAFNPTGSAIDPAAGTLAVRGVR